MPILVLRSSTIALQGGSELKKGMDTFRVGSLGAFLNKIHSDGPVLRLLFCALQVNSHKNAISWEASKHSCHQGIKNCRVWVDYLCAWYFFQLCNFWFQLATAILKVFCQKLQKSFISFTFLRFCRWLYCKDKDYHDSIYLMYVMQLTPIIKHP